MSRPLRWLVWSVCLIAPASLMMGAPVEGAEPARPNILWLTTEDISPDLGCYGDAEARTPNLDRLASQGALFRRAFSCAGVCAPSRSGIITGMYPTSIGTHHMRSKGVPPASVKCFPEYLRAAGYYCTNNSKTDYNFDAPATAWDENGAQAHYKNRPAGAPFFAVFNNVNTHESKIRCPPAEFNRITAALKPEERHDPARAQLPPYYPDTPVTRKDWTQYYDLITAMDKTVAGYLKQLEDEGLAENTVVFFYGDHGRGLPRGKRWTYDSGIRAPLIVRWPGKIKPGTEIEDLVSFIDLGPTLLSIAGVPIPSHMQGRAFLGSQAAPPRPYVFAARDRMDEAYDVIRAVRDKRFKYLRNFEPERPYAQRISYMDEMPTMREWRRLAALDQLVGPQKLFFQPTKPVEELYDTESDPHEVQNLAKNPEHYDTLLRMRAALAEWQRETGDLGLVSEAELQERARPNGKWATTAVPRILRVGGVPSLSALVRVDCPTEGASIAYTTDVGKDARWKLYAGEVSVKSGLTLRAKACRLGFKDSAEVQWTADDGPPRDLVRNDEGRSLEQSQADLDHERRDIRLAAARALGAFGAKGVPALTTALKHKDDAVRRWAALGLIAASRNTGTDPDETQRAAQSALREALADPSADVRVCAARALWRLAQSKEALEALGTALKDPNPSVRLLAAQALGEMGPASKDALDALKAAQDDSDEYVRRSAAHAIERVSGKAE